MIDFAYGDGTVALTADMRPKVLRKLVDDTLHQVSGRGVVIALNAERALPHKLVEAAADAAADRDDVCLYVVGDGSQLRPDDLAPFSRIRHLNLNTHNLVGHDFLTAFAELRSLTVQGHSPRPIDLAFLRGMTRLEQLGIPAAVKSEAALESCPSLTLLGCTSNANIFAALAGHSALQYLDVSFGTNRDLTGLPEIPRLRGVALYQVRGLTGDDLQPLANCAGLVALSLGALRNVNHLSALAGGPNSSLQALLLEQLSSLESLRDVAACGVLAQLGLYESRPTDKSLAPLRDVPTLTHLVLGDVYPKVEIDNLLSWYSGALRYRDKIERGEFKPRWRTRIDRLVSDRASPLRTPSTS